VPKLTAVKPREAARALERAGFSFYSAEDGGYIADIPDLQACSAFGRTPEEALAQVECAKKAWLTAARRKHKPIPPPRYRPVIYQLPELKVAT
jgi:predicted RNase H-like HicB family nuclease